MTTEKTNKNNTKQRITGKHIIVSVLLALLITGLGVLSAPLDLSTLTTVNRILLILSPVIPLFFFFLFIEWPTRSVFRFLKTVYCIGAPAIPILWIPVIFAHDRVAEYTDHFIGRFLPKWGALWWLGIILVYAILQLSEYVMKRADEKRESSRSLLYDLTVMYTPQKTISAKKREGRSKWAALTICMVLMAPALFLFCHQCPQMV